MRFIYNKLQLKGLKYSSISMVTAFFMLLFLSMEALSQYKPVVRGERPPIDLNNVPEDAYEKGVLRIKLDEAAYKNIAEAELDRTETGVILLGLPGVDALNTQFGVRNAKKTFDSPALNNRFTDRHRLWGFHLWFDLWVDESADVIAMVKAYMQLDEVAFAEPHYKKELIGHVSDDGEELTYTESGQFSDREAGQLFPDDPDFDAQWHYHNTGQTGGLVGADISLPEAWTIETGNIEVIVAVVDGGIGITHPDLAGNIWEGVGYNFVSNTPTIIPHDHGSHVGGTIGAVTHNNLGVSGIAGGWGTGSPGVALMSAQVFEPGWGQSGGFAVAPIYAADNGAAISQNSWGYTSSGYYEQSVLDAIDYFNENGGGDVMDGGLTIFAAGNSSNSGPNYPGYYEGAIAVAALNHNDQLAWYSNFGGHIEVSAPGGETNTVTEQGVLSTMNTGYGYYQGTSMACPHVSGVVALMLSLAPGEFSNDEIWEMVMNTTDNIYPQNPGYIGQLGTGRVNAHAALLELLYHMADPEAPAAPTNFTVTADEEGELSAELSWTNPVENASGEELFELDTIYIFRNNALIHYLLDPVIGEDASYVDEDIDEAGFYNYTIRGANFAGTGLATSKGAYIGHDVPAAPQNILLAPQGDGGQLTWDAPEVGHNGGFFDGTNLTYTIVRFPDETEVVTDVTGTSYLDTEVPHVGNFYYEITAHNHIGQGGTGESNVATLGAEGLLIYEPFDLPVNTLPTGWVVEGLGQGNWNTHNSETAGGEAPQMRLNWSPTFTGVSKLLTHAVNIAGVSELGFSFRNYFRKYSSQIVEASVLYTVDDGDSWTELWSYDGAGDYGPHHEEFIFDVPPGSEYIQFAFKWDGYTWEIWDWNIDDVVLEALGTADHYSVLFEVHDEDGNPVPDAVITLNGYENDPGEYMFTQLEPGTHEFSVSAMCYLPKQDHLTISDEDKVVEIILENHPGDANADGVVNVLDIISITNYFVENDPQPFCFNNADVNEDGVIDVLDVIGTMNIFLEMKLHPYPGMRSNEAHLYLNHEGIIIESDGSLAGLQFELTGNMPAEGSLKLALAGYELVYLHEEDRIKAMIFSLENKPLTDGKHMLVVFETAGELPQWGDVRAGNLNAEEVPVATHKEVITELVEPVNDFDFRAYPNPAGDDLWVELYNSSDAPVVITLVNLKGDVVKMETVTDQGMHSIRFDVKQLSQGMYILNIEADKEHYTEKIMIN